MFQFTTHTYFIKVQSLMYIWNDIDNRSINFMYVFSTTMTSSLAEIAGKTGQQPGNIFCLNDQTNIACFMIIRGV